MPPADTAHRTSSRGHDEAASEVTPGRRPVMDFAGVDSELIDWSATRRQQIEDVLEGLTYKYGQEHGRLPGEQARHGWAGGRRRTPAGRRRPPSRWGSCARGGVRRRSCASARRWSRGCWSGAARPVRLSGPG